MKRPFVVFAGAVCLGLCSVWAKQGPSDWKPAKVDVPQLGRNVDKMFPSFRYVACGVTLQYKAPTSKDPTGVGHGDALMNEYFWSPTRFRLHYLAYPRPFRSKETKALVIPEPTTEYLAFDGKVRRRLGPAVGPSNTNYAPSQKVFDAATDAQLVEMYPTQFPKLLFSPFAGGNATLSRYLIALSKGVGGYTITTSARDVTMGGKSIHQVRLVAKRPAKGNLPDSTVEMVFQGSAPYMPVTVHTTYGPKNELRWSGQWYNHANLDKVAPRGPFDIRR